METPLDTDTGTSTNIQDENPKATLEAPEWIAKRTAQIEERLEQPAGETETGTRNEANEPQQASTEPAPVDSSANISPPQEENSEPQDEKLKQMSEFFDSLTQDQKETHARNIGTGMGKDFYKSRQRTKAAEEELAALRQEYKEKQEKQEKKEPLVSRKNIKNPLNSLNTFEELNEERDKAVDLLKWGNAGLFNEPDDDGFVGYIGDKGYTQKQMWSRVCAAQDTLTTHLPEREKELNAASEADILINQFNEKRQYFDSQGRVFFPEWWEDNEKRENKVLDNMMSNPILKSVAENLADGKLYLAAAAETLIRRGIIPGKDDTPTTGNGTPPPNGQKLPAEGARPNPPIVPTGSANLQATPTTPRRTSQSLKDLEAVQTEINNSGVVGMDPALWRRKRELQNKL